VNARKRACMHPNARASIINGELKTFCAECKEWVEMPRSELPDVAACASQVPMGKYAGKRFDEVPISYLEWMAVNLKGALARRAVQVQRVLASRGKIEPLANADELQGT